MGTAGIRCHGALLGYSAVGHCRDILRMGAAGIIEHCSQAPRGGPGQHRLLKSKNSTARLGKRRKTMGGLHGF